MGNKSHNLAYCSFNPKLFTISVKSKVPFQCCSYNYVADCWWICGMVTICLIRKGKYDWFLHKGLLLDWLIFLLYLLQSVCCSKYSAKTTNFSALNVFLHFLHQFVWKHFRIFATVMLSKFHFLLKISTRVT